MVKEIDKKDLAPKHGFLFDLKRLGMEWGNFFRELFGIPKREQF